VPVKAVVECRDVESSIYELPLALAAENLDELVVQRLGMTVKPRDLSNWQDVVRKLKYPTNHVRIGVVGKYIDLQDAYKSVYESIIHGGIANDCGVEIVRLDAEDVEKIGMGALQGLDGILVPGGFGDRGVEGKIMAVKYARENRIPYYGLCLGMQVSVIEFARHACGLADANSTEFEPNTKTPVIDIMEEQKTVTEKGGTMRLGSYECRLQPGSHAFTAYGTDTVHERHRHRFEFNNKYRDQLAAAGLRIGGINPLTGLVEIVEVVDHPWFVGVQYHPEFKSKPTQPHPLFAAFVKAALKNKKK
jgi:CTP synthase